MLIANPSSPHGMNRCMAAIGIRSSDAQQPEIEAAHGADQQTETQEVQGGSASGQAQAVRMTSAIAERPPISVEPDLKVVHRQCNWVSRVRVSE